MLIKTLLLTCVGAVLTLAQSWTPQTSGSTASLRGLSAVTAQVAWASGSKGTFLVTLEGGAHWRAGEVLGASESDFREGPRLDEALAPAIRSSRSPTVCQRLSIPRIQKRRAVRRPHLNPSQSEFLKCSLKPFSLPASAPC